MKRWILVVLIALVLATVVIMGLTQIRLDAIQEPGRIETFLATLVKHLLVSRSSRDDIPPAPTNFRASIEEGYKLYGTDCSMCHGPDLSSTHRKRLFGARKGRDGAYFSPSPPASQRFPIASLPFANATN
jgi:cytochrome c553